MHRFNRQAHLPVESAVILAQRSFLYFYETKVTGKRLSQN